MIINKKWIFPILAITYAGCMLHSCNAKAQEISPKLLHSVTTCQADINTSYVSGVITGCAYGVIPASLAGCVAGAVAFSSVAYANDDLDGCIRLKRAKLG